METPLGMLATGQVPIWDAPYLSACMPLQQGQIDNMGGGES